MNLDNTKKEEEAIKDLENAFKKCSKLGIRFSVMDYDLKYANKRLYKECEKIQKSKNSISGVYPAVAYAQNTDLGYCPGVNCHNSMESCGGW